MSVIVVILYLLFFAVALVPVAMLVLVWPTKPKRRGDIVAVYRREADGETWVRWR